MIPPHLLPQKIDFNKTITIKLYSKYSDEPEEYTLVTSMELKPYEIKDDEFIDTVVISGYVKTQKMIKPLTGGGFVSKNSSLPNFHIEVLAQWALSKIIKLELKLSNNKWITIDDTQYMQYPFSEDNPHGAIYEALQVFYK